MSSLINGALLFGALTAALGVGLVVGQKMPHDATPAPSKVRTFHFVKEVEGKPYPVLSVGIDGTVTLEGKQLAQSDTLKEVMQKYFAGSDEEAKKRAEAAAPPAEAPKPEAPPAPPAPKPPKK